MTRPAARSPWGAAQTPSAEGGLCRVIPAGHGLALPADGSQAESCPQVGRWVTQSCTRRRPPKAPRASARASQRLHFCTSRTWCVCAQTCVRSRSFCLTLVFDGPRAPVSAAAVGSCPCGASPACSLHGASPSSSLPFLPRHSHRLLLRGDFSCFLRFRLHCVLRGSRSASLRRGGVQSSQERRELQPMGGS